MQDFTGGGIHALPIKSTRSCGDPEFDRRIAALVQEWGVEEKTGGLVAELIMTALKLGRDQTPVADLKLFNRSLREMRAGSRVFAPYRNRRKVVVFGSARTDPREGEFQAAEAFAARIRELGYVIITGGGDGIMGAAQKGAGREASFGLNIRLPFEQRANETIDGDSKLVNFNYFFTRKLNFVKESHAVVLFPGGFGTMDEAFEVLTLMQTGKARILPVVMVDKANGTYWRTWNSFLAEYLLKLGLVSAEDFHLFKVTDNIDDAISEIEQFYRNFRSYRWVGERLVIRMNYALADSALFEFRERFHDIIGDHQLEQTVALPEEHNEPELANLPRLVFIPARKNFGRFRQLIDAINVAPPAE
ncbi:MAG: TIGR00730 family Rossman fold protein [Verrucomicrobiota bacterium]